MTPIFCLSLHPLEVHPVISPSEASAVTVRVWFSFAGSLWFSWVNDPSGQGIVRPERHEGGRYSLQGRVNAGEAVLPQIFHPRCLS